MLRQCEMGGLKAVHLNRPAFSAVSPTFSVASSPVTSILTSLPIVGLEQLIDSEDCDDITWVKI